MRIYVSVRTIPEISEAFGRRLNKKDSFDRWLKKNDPTITFIGKDWVPIENEH